MPFTKEETAYFDSLRDIYFSNSDNFISLIKKDYIEEYGDITKEIAQQNTSQIIERLIKIGREKWNKIRLDIQRNWVESFLDDFEHLSEKFPNLADKLKNLINDLESINSNNKKIIAVHQSLFEITSNLEWSNRQAAKNLAGFTFEACIKIVLESLNCKFETQKELSEGEVLDFIYPNLKTAIANPSNCIVTECQTTLKDRFRLSLGKVPRGNPIDSYIFTAGGLGVITANDKNDLTDNKVEEIKEKGWKIVVFKKFKDETFNNNPIVISFEDFFNRYYPSKETLW